MDNNNNKTPGLEYGLDKLDWVDNSRLTCFDRCPRKFFYQYMCGLREGEMVAADYGTALHCGCPYALRKDIVKAKKAFDDSWTHDDVGDDKRNTLKGHQMLEVVLKNHDGRNGLWFPVERPQLEFEVEEDISEDEIPFAVDLGFGVPFIGRIDALVKHRDTGELFVMDYKSVSWLSQNWIDSFFFSPQLRGYVVALKVLMGLEKISGAIIEALHVLKSGPKNLTLPPFRYRDFQLDEWMEWALLTVGNMLECFNNGIYPKNVNGCNSYPSHGTAGFMCNYARLCSVEDWTDIKDLYRVDHWKPFVVVGDDKDNKNG